MSRDNRKEPGLKIKFKIRKVMKERALTPTKIEQYVPMSKRTIYRIMNGEKMPSILELAYLAGVLNLSIQDLIEVEWKGRDLLEKNQTTKEE